MFPGAGQMTVLPLACQKTQMQENAQFSIHLPGSHLTNVNFPSQFQSGNDGITESNLILKQSNVPSEHIWEHSFVQGGGDPRLKYQPSESVYKKTLQSCAHEFNVLLCDALCGFYEESKTATES